MRNWTSVCFTFVLAVSAIAALPTAARNSDDETHGVKLTLYPEGTKDKTIVGLKFDHPEENGKVDKGVDQVLEFVAEKPGTYQFECAKVCGIHHGKMKGELVVE